MLVILYASQTGNAEWIATHIYHEAVNRGYKDCVCKVLDDFEQIDFGAPSVIIFVASTTGDGDPPDNATKFWRWFRRGKKEDLAKLQGKKYALLGLGDTNYSNFCNTAKRLDRKLGELGALPIIPKGLADDATGLEAVVDPWMDKLFANLPEHAPHDEGKRVAYEAQLQQDGQATGGVGIIAKMKEKRQDSKSIETTSSTTPSAQVAELENKISNLELSTSVPDKHTKNESHGQRLDLPADFLENLTQVKGLAKKTMEFVQVEPTVERRSTEQSSANSVYPLLKEKNSNSPCPVLVTRVRCLTGTKAEKRVIEIELDVSKSDLKTWEYRPGDAFAIVCPNAECDVKALLERLNLEQDVICDIKVGDGGEAIVCPQKNTPMTYYELFKFFLDIRGFPRKPFFRMLSDYTSDEVEKKWLLVLSSTSGSSILTSLRAKNPTLLDWLTTFPSCNPPVARLIEHVSKLQPRYYSIATYNNHLITFAFNIVEYQDSFGRTVRGLATGWLDDLTHHTLSKSWTTLAQPIDIPVFIKPPGEFRMNTINEHHNSILMIAAGTGISPFIGFLQRMADMKQSLKHVWLIYGARFEGEEGDICFEKELTEFADRGVLNRLDICYSRQPRQHEPRPIKESRVWAWEGVYVQHVVHALKDQVWDLVHQQQGKLYVCGSMNMAKDLHMELINIANQTTPLVVPSGSSSSLESVDHQEKTVNGAEYWTSMTKMGRYIREIWG